MTYHDLDEAEYEKILATFLPSELARALADADTQSIDGAIDDQSHTLSSLIGRETTPLAEIVAQALKGV
jgi:NAD(P)H dehydrogenase (quinone)